MSNKTPVNHAAKTASAPKSKKGLLWFVIWGGLSIAMLLVIYTSLLVSGLVVLTKTDECNDEFYASQTSDDLTVRGKTFNTKKLTDEISRQKGLSGRGCIPEDSAMEFVFDKPAKYCFWMKEMNFSIDIVWLDEKGVVNYILRNVSPESYPTSFCPEDDGRYVLEFKAGTAARLELTDGDKVTL